jgi:hypothetical protein
MHANQKEWIALVAVLALLPAAAFAYTAAEQHAALAEAGGASPAATFASAPNATTPDHLCPHDNATANATATPPSPAA